MATAKTEKTKGQNAGKGYLVVSIMTSIRPDMEFLMDDLDSDPDNEYFNWLYKKNGSTEDIKFDCSEKLVDALAAFEEDEDNDGNSIDGMVLSEIGKEVGEEDSVNAIIDKCYDAAIQMYAKETYEESMFRKDWRDGINEIREIDDKKIREQWKELLKRNIDKGLATDCYTLEEFKEECIDNPRPKNDTEWKKAYDKYIDSAVEEYYYELDNYPDKEKHLKDSGLKSYDEANCPSMEQCLKIAKSYYCDCEETWEVTDYGKN